MINLIIFGGKGNGTVLLESILDINKTTNEEQYNVIGFINNQYGVIKEIEGYPVLGDIDDLESLLYYHNAFFINSISSVQTMDLVYQMFENQYRKLSDRLISIVHPSCFIGSNVKIDIGCYIGPQCYIGQNVTIGKHCFIHSQCYIARDSKLSNYNYLAPKVYIGAEVSIGKSVYIGVGALIKERLCISEKSVIGMGSIIVENTESNSRYYGEKAKKRN